MGTGNYITTIIISALFFLAVLPIIFSAPHFVTFMLIWVGLLLLAIISAGSVYSESFGAWSLYAITYAGCLFFAIGLYFFTSRIFLFASATVLSVLGFLQAVLAASTGHEPYDEPPKYPEKEDKKEEVFVEEIKPMMTPPPEEKKLAGEKKPEEKKLVKKYVASTSGTSYHSPKCVAAKRINSKNAVWFKSGHDAEKRGYKAHNCV